MSFTATGTPWRMSRAVSLSRSPAIRRARSGSSQANARMAGSVARYRSSAASTSSRLPISRAAIARAA